MRKKLAVVVVFVTLAVMTLFSVRFVRWLHHPIKTGSMPGYAWVATTDGSSDTSARVDSILHQHGILSEWNSGPGVDFYVPTNQVARARLVLAIEKLMHRRSISEIY